MTPRSITPLLLAAATSVLAGGSSPVSKPQCPAIAAGEQIRKRHSPAIRSYMDRHSWAMATQETNAQLDEYRQVERAYPACKQDPIFQAFIAGSFDDLGYIALWSGDCSRAKQYSLKVAKMRTLFPKAGVDGPWVLAATGVEIDRFQAAFQRQCVAPPPALSRPTAPIPQVPTSEPAKRTYVEDPVYPETARQQQIQGRVQVEFTITIDGIVANAHVVATDNPMLNEAALSAVRRWKYSPATENGKAVPSTERRTLRFALH